MDLAEFKTAVTRAIQIAAKARSWLSLLEEALAQVEKIDDVRTDSFWDREAVSQAEHVVLAKLELLQHILADAEYVPDMEQLASVSKQETDNDYETVARHIIADAVDSALEDAWEVYCPDVGEDDYDEIAKAVQRLAPDNGDTDAYRAAYGRMRARAQQWATEHPRPDDCMWPDDERFL